MKKLTTYAFGLILCSSLALTSCGKDSKKPEEAQKGAHQSATRVMKEITVADLHKKQQQNSSSFYLLDVREPSEYKQASIAGSVLIPLGSVSARLSEIPKDKPVIIHCKSGRRSASASKILLDNGFTDVTNVTGGIDAWKAAGYATKP